ncbi:hypothetical protein H4F17_13820 [Vibrio cholerae]
MEPEDLKRDDFYEYIQDRLQNGYNCPTCKTETFPALYTDGNAESGQSIVFTKLDFFTPLPDRQLSLKNNMLVIPCICTNCCFLSHFSAYDIASYLTQKRGV